MCRRGAWRESEKEAIQMQLEIREISPTLSPPEREGLGEAEPIALGIQIALFATPR